MNDLNCFRNKASMTCLQGITMPIKEKISKLTVCLDKSLGGTELATAEVDMGNYSYGQYNLIKLNLEQCPGNTEYPFDPSETVLEVGLKGTRADGLV